MIDIYFNSKFFILFFTIFNIFSSDKDMSKKFLECFNLDNSSCNYENYSNKFYYFRITLFDNSDKVIGVVLIDDEKKPVSKYINAFCIILKTKNDLSKYLGDKSVVYRKTIKEKILKEYLERISKCVVGHEIKNDKNYFHFSITKLLETFKNNEKFKMIIDTQAKVDGMDDHLLKDISDIKSNKICRLIKFEYETLKKYWHPYYGECEIEKLNSQLKYYYKEDTSYRSFSLYLNYDFEENIEVQNYDELNFSGLITNEKLNHFVNKYFIDICERKVKNLNCEITEGNINCDFEIKENKIIGTHKVKFSTKIKSENSKIIIPVIYIDYKRNDIHKDVTNTSVDLIFKNRQLQTESLVNLMKNVYNLKLEEDINNYGFTLFPVDYPCELIFGLKPFQEEILIYKSNSNKKMDGYETYIGIDNKNYINSLNKNLEKEIKYNETIKNGIGYKFYYMNIAEALIKNTTNWYEIEDDKNLKLNIKDFSYIVNIFNKEGRITASSDLLKQMKELIKLIKIARQNTINDERLKKKKSNITREMLDSNFKQIFKIVKQTEIKKYSDNFDFEKVDNITINSNDKYDDFNIYDENNNNNSSEHNTSKTLNINNSSCCNCNSCNKR